MTKEKEIFEFLNNRVFNPILTSPKASDSLKQGIRLTIMRLNERDAKGMVSYFWSAMAGTEKSNKFAKKMRAEGFLRFEEVFEEFRERFDEKWLRKKS